MKEDDELNSDIKDGQEMKDFLAKSKFGNAVLVVKADLLNRFEATKEGQVEERNEVWRQLRSLDLIVKQLESVIITGELAEKTLLERAKSVIGM